jgi:hypothetical protein
MKKLFMPIMAMVILAACNEEVKQDPAKKQDGTKKETTSSANNAPVKDWMSWEGGVDIAAVTDANYKMPNIIFHVANMVNTPVGSAPSGMILYRPDTTKAPIVMGFVSGNKTVGAYFGPKIFAGTPFEKAPALDATFDIKYDVKTATAKVVVGGHTFEATLTDLGNPYLIDRAMGSPMPFYQQGVEQKVGKATLKVDGVEVKIMIPPVGIAGGPGSVVSPNGVYAR